MNQPIHLSLISILLLALIATAAMAWAPANEPAKAIQIQYNGFGWATETKAQDISELLIETFGGYEGWQITPLPETRLVEGTVVSIMDSSVSGLNEVVATNLKTEIKKYEEAKKEAKPKSPIYAGLATWYDFGDQLTTASRRFPSGTRLRIVAVNSGKTVDVTVNDFGPQAWTGVELDLNRPAFVKLAPLGAGKINIKYFKI